MLATFVRPPDELLELLGLRRPVRMADAEIHVRQAVERQAVTVFSSGASSIGLPGGHPSAP